MIDENPMTMQIGGDHYKDFKIAPIEYIYKNNISLYPLLSASAVDKGKCPKRPLF